METKICNKCGGDKPYTEYHKMVGCIGGVRTTCKECRKKEKEEYSNLPHVKLKSKQYYQEHKASIRVRTAAHYWTLNGQYHQYKKRAKKEEIEFFLSQQECIPFFNALCTYCPNTTRGLGIDRVDNTIGYTLSNCTSCCKRCNWMKREMTKEDFLTHIKSIYEKNFR